MHFSFLQGRSIKGNSKIKVLSILAHYQVASKIIGCIHLARPKTCFLAVKLNIHQLLLSIRHFFSYDRHFIAPGTLRQNRSNCTKDNHLIVKRMCDCIHVSRRIRKQAICISENKDAFPAFIFATQHDILLLLLLLLLLKSEISSC